MKIQTESRGPSLDIEKCVENIGNRYDLVIVAAARSRALKRANRLSNRREHVFTILTALEDIQSGKIGKNYNAEKEEMQRELNISNTKGNSKWLLKISLPRHASPVKHFA